MFQQIIYLSLVILYWILTCKQMSEMYEHLITVSQTADAYSGSDCFL